MKTRKIPEMTVNLKILMVLPVIVIVLLALSSCSEKKIDEISSAQSTSVKSNSDITDPVYIEVDQLPVFTAGGDTALLNYIAKHTIYPKDAMMNNIQGKVVLKLIVQKDGMVNEVEVLKGVDPSLNAEAVRVVKSLPKFEKPAIKNGKPVAVHYMIPINFALK